ncbi:MAG: hypothetical protein LBE91_18365 [Tannerella sp.]|jgi:hypothetical protein|nr:hypothetical protein [Tannerella sp.]
MKRKKKTKIKLMVIGFVIISIIGIKAYHDYQRYLWFQDPYNAESYALRASDTGGLGLFDGAW